MDKNCDICGGCGWVCENHQGAPWAGISYSPDGCGCGCGAGLACVCNQNGLLPEEFGVRASVDGECHGGTWVN